MVLFGLAALLSAFTLGGSPPSVPPEHHSWGYLCPAEYPIIVFRGHYYPPLYPTLPSQKLRWDRCFRTTADAARAGYKRMPTPRGFQYVEGIYLYPSLNLLKPYCRTAAQSTGFGVPCPAFTPGVPAGFVGCVNIQRCYSTGEFVLEGKSFGPLSSYRGASTESCAPPPRRTCTTVHNVIHLLFVAASPEKLSEVECCGARATNDRVTVRGRPARWLTFPPGSDLNSGHVLLEWHVAGVTYGVSLHADNKTNRHLAQLLAKYVQLVK